MGSGGEEQREGRSPEAESDGVDVEGHTFWRARSVRGVVELISESGIELDAARCRWTVKPTGASRGELVESGSREVRRFVGGVLMAMERATRRAAPVAPLFKPQPVREAPRPATAPVPCPLCVGEGGEVWFDCELCDGEGVVTARRAGEWWERHGD